MEEGKKEGECQDKTLNMKPMLDAPSNSQKKIIWETVGHSI